MQQLTVLEVLSLSRKSERLKRDVQAEFVPEFEAIHLLLRKMVRGSHLQARALPRSARRKSR
jgi:hypothetical protein